MNNKIIINGIDVSECPLFYDHKIGCYHTFDGKCAKNNCVLYKWILEHKHLQEENKRLQMLSCVNCGEKYLSPDGAELYDKNVQLQKENEELKTQIKDLQIRKDKYYLKTLEYERIISDYITALEEIRNIAEKLITELPEYNSCYYKDECGDNCTPKKQSKVEYCCYENVDKILATINEVLK